MEGLRKSKIEIPDDVVMEILLKLSVKSLLRFRCVCKAWFSSFQTPQFIAKNHQNNLQSKKLNLLVKLCHSNTRPSEDFFSALSVQQRENDFVSENIHLPFFEKSYSAMVCPCNGLLCLYHEEEIALWNPSTREFKILPKSTVERPSSYCQIVGELGFGFDSIIGDYKVVRFVYNLSNSLIYQAEVELYSLKSDSWKLVSYLKPELIPNDFPLYSNGFCYWLIGYNILSFDMIKEEFSLLPLPCTFDEVIREYDMDLLDFNGSLGVFVYYKEEGGFLYYAGQAITFIDLWVMNDSWIKQFRIELIPIINKPLGLWKNGQIFFESLSCELLLFDPVTRKLNKLDLNGCPNMQVITYIESLVPISGRSEHEEGILRWPRMGN